MIFGVVARCNGVFPDLSDLWLGLAPFSKRNSTIFSFPYFTALWRGVRFSQSPASNTAPWLIRYLKYQVFEIISWNFYSYMYNAVSKLISYIIKNYLAAVTSEFFAAIWRGENWRMLFFSLTISLILGHALRFLNIVSKISSTAWG